MESWPGELAGNSRGDAESAIEPDGGRKFGIEVASGRIILELGRAFRCRPK
jgi:hypothetical protein